ncbi:endodeoxyribonuclease [Fulvimarina sp. 2208YS6-2-32]|uniref:Endodeoxyribonuclease n=1 Tax=Fulvimarina uroteuthidis TaxID=3098149 RepID=A0ABU5I168_9HYPH|nr:endodeoxyribonuclease [Fulvimarina sp. 2208YS6-2-32]MDY8109123.1 endodeoxyribonuclease [Fulvimarina sp. 2208YS6-2-32]
MKHSPYRNKFEAKVAGSLDRAFAYEAHRFPYTLAHTYLPDFIDVPGKRIVEAKGRFTGSDRAKMRAIRAAYPDWEIVIVFQNPAAKINKNSKTSYSDWCQRHGISWRAG